MISEKGESSYNLFEEGDARGSFAMRAWDAGSDMGCYGFFVPSHFANYKIVIQLNYFHDLIVA